MKNDETGEFELVLGNRQLLSGFFIVVILFAVFFVMGYIVGRNSTPAQMAATRDQSGGATPRPQLSPPATTPIAPPVAADSAKDQTAGAAQSQPAEPVKQPESKSEPVSEPAASAPAEPASVEMFLQVTSLKPPASDTAAGKLKEKGFPTTLSPGPNGYMRVWVGPYTDRGKLGEDKAKLELLGFNPIVVKPQK
jgi:cell division septation protein DedD